MNRKESHLFQKQSLQLVATVINAETIRGIDDPYQSISLFKVIPPVRPQSLLPANVPDVELISILVSSKAPKQISPAESHP
jgi:hypothetical protein